MLYTAIILGLLGSFHCIGMCGPIAFMLPLRNTGKSSKIVKILLYHTGRLMAYGLLGLIFGVLGKGLYLFGMQQRLSLLIGILMIIVVLLPIQIFNKYNFSKPAFRLVTRIKSGLGNALKKQTADTFLTIGLLNGLLPCGLVYMAIFGAIATGDAAQGVLYMVLFGAGTMPLMTLAVYAGNFLSGAARKRITKAIPYIIIIIGILFIIRGLGLGIPYLSPQPAVETASSSIECH
ncbi:sulfite exporter TauE/SafE family protein [Ascidiimonas aurantiaca]|uniref:sulfite exporter TauE/SafE family protein n=1 Tax=Ascidiimonas aurantiaca TaxID=1685432 RepID=UPI0030EE23C5